MIDHPMCGFFTGTMRKKIFGAALICLVIPSVQALAPTIQKGRRAFAE